VNETELVARARQGEQAAWSTLIEQHQTAVFRLAYLLLANTDEAKDVAQETFIRAFQALSHFDSARPLRPWLLSITTNLARNQRRAIGRYLAAVGRFFQIGAEPPLAANPGEIHLQQWEAQQLWQAVRRLGHKDQEIIYLRYFLELSVAETAEITRLPSGTIKSRLHRSLGRLRAVLETEFPNLAEEGAE
jgi:RNA polymerase sigma-70 factor (ECF subfamily)